MLFKQITDQDREAFNKVVSHPLQSYEWGKFRERSRVKVIRRGIYTKDKLVDGFQLTIHPIPHTPFTIGYLPKGNKPTKEVLEELLKIGKQEKCIFIQLEPDVMIQDSGFKIKDLTLNSQFPTLNLQLAAHPLFTKYTFTLDLTKTEEELLKAMHPKTRYNIKVANKHGVEVKENNSNEAFERYWQLTKETTARQGFYAHNKRYHELQWQTFSHTLGHPELDSGSKEMPKPSDAKAIAGRQVRHDNNQLTSHLFLAAYQGKILTTMLFFIFHDTMYYPYGASSDEDRSVMHSTLTMWEAIRFGKKLGLKKFDMWGALGPSPDPKDPWLGFHTFKQRFGPQKVEFIGSYDLIINPLLYQLYVLTDKLRWMYLKMKK
jgi:lipid II:glycine glycyltransferase (peptidoglycan interpeptide bridge formation enzyme)